MEVEIIKFDDLGQGIAKINNQVCFVKKGLPGEILDIEIKNAKKNYQVAEIKKIIKENENRVIPICKYYDKCGGCNFLHANYSLEKEFKINKCLNYFNKCDGFFETKNLNYRNKVILHVENGKLGYYKEHSNILVEIDYCYLLSPKINKIIEILNENYDFNFNGEVLIRENSKSETLLSIKGEYKYLNNLKNQAEINNLIYNSKVIKGLDYFIETVDNYKFKVNYNSFFQVNSSGLLKIKEILVDNLKNKKLNNILDLYSGTSVLGIFLSQFGRVTSIEENEYATSDAKVNLSLNNINNLKVITGKVEEKLPYLKNLDLIVVDPARRGLNKRALTKILSLNSKYLIYISCHMISLKRDLETLKELYNISNIYLVDMFPRTNKVETICFLELKDK